MRTDCLIVALCLLATMTEAQRSDDDHWVWRTYNRQQRAFRGSPSTGIKNTNDDKYRRELYTRDREPTTRRPLPGEPENDEIEDYADIDPNKQGSPNVGTRQFNPYGGGGSGLFNAGQFTGLGGYGGSPGILVGPGGPTGIIGRPQQQQFPGQGVYQPGFGGFNGAQNGIGGYPGVYGGNVGFNGIGGLPGAGFSGTQPQTGFAGFPGQQSGLGQYPAAGQYPFTQYPVPSGQYPGAEYASGQFPNSAQYPGNAYPGPQYTEGYGLATPNGQLGIYPNQGLRPGNFFDENTNKPNSVAADGKSLKNVELQGEGRSTGNPSVNDKLNNKKL
ncbi:collagen alpha-5(IV) chain [Scaptodrosophila lebanonensis]|uniref:Collagen alpha-5(IV) chain n=1 Tax=Drosophila lebanonensis TaxID=7225 RepID=A0A6J2TKK5_DROLE|nr:collagen alpha-5(IV) chain [Scaptodrosophila lebanonensis]